MLVSVSLNLKKNESIDLCIELIQLCGADTHPCCLRLKELSLHLVMP